MDFFNVMPVQMRSVCACVGWRSERTDSNDPQQPFCRRFVFNEMGVVSLDPNTVVFEEGMLPLAPFA